MYSKTQVARILGIRVGTMKANMAKGNYDPLIGEIARDKKGHRAFTKEQVKTLYEWYSDSHVQVRCISLGGGVQSTTMVLMHLLEKAFNPPPDIAMFIDLGWERVATYGNIIRLQQLSGKQGFSVKWIKNRDIRSDILTNVSDRTKRLNTPPMFYRNEAGKTAQIARECTATYKIEAIENELRKHMGIPPGMVMRYRAETWIGITTDEAQRMRTNNDPKWIANKYPLIDLGMSRKDCIRWLEDHGWNIPAKSSCLGCPYKPKSEWADMKFNRPDEWNNVVQVDRAVRNGVNNIDKPVFLHQSLTPLEDLQLSEPTKELKYDECSGYCHT